MMKRFVYIIICAAVICSITAACRVVPKEKNEKSETTSQVDSSSKTDNNESSAYESDNESYVEDPYVEENQDAGGTSKSPNEITKVKGIPVAEINAKKSKEIALKKYGLVEEFENGDFVLFVGRQCYFSYCQYCHEGKIGKLQVIKYDKNGKVLWDKKYDTLTDQIYATAALSDGGVLVATDTDYRNFDYDIPTSNEMFTKINADGSMAWSKKLTKNFEFIDSISEAPNGVIYASGVYTGSKESSKEGFDHIDASPNFQATFTKYDKNGKQLDSHLPRDGYNYLWEGPSNSCKAQYKEGVGYIADFGSCIVCYDENYNKKWIVMYKNVTTSLGEEDKPDTEYDIFSTEMCLTLEGVVVSALRNDGKKGRTLKISYDGKLISEKEFSTVAYSRLFVLPDGRAVVVMYPEKGKKSVVLYFVKDGKLSEFDSFETSLYASELTLTSDGGFFIEYSGDSGVDYDEPYIVATKYSSTGKVEYQRVFRNNVMLLKNGTVLNLKNSFFKNSD